MAIDRRRRFELPNIQDLSKDQDAALALPSQGQHLVIGGPGTGKSVVALLRARRLVTESVDYRFLAYNKLLDQSSRHLFGGNLRAFTLDSWFRTLWRYLFREPVPLMPPERSGYRAIDWPEVMIYLQEGGQSDYKRPLPFLIIDEGQDMPPAFYSALANIGFENFYVVADQNQQIHPEKCSSRQDIENALGVDPADTMVLLANYRNTLPIAQLAQHFYPEDPASPRPDLPPPKTGASTPELWRYGDDAGHTLEAIAELILQMSDRNPRKLIGVITPNNRIREKFVNALDRVNPALDHDKPQVMTFVSGQGDELDFGIGGIMVINAHSCKGLEFETVVLADIDEHQPRNLDVLKKRFYVMVARAREQIILLRTGRTMTVIDDLLPEDQAILARK